jgi:hypothetical protein
MNTPDPNQVPTLKRYGMISPELSEAMTPHGVIHMADKGWVFVSVPYPLDVVRVVSDFVPVLNYLESRHLMIMGNGERLHTFTLAELLQARRERG